MNFVFENSSYNCSVGLRKPCIEVLHDPSKSIYADQSFRFVTQIIFLAIPINVLYHTSMENFNVTPQMSNISRTMYNSSSNL